MFFFPSLFGFFQDFRFVFYFFPGECDTRNSRFFAMYPAWCLLSELPRSVVGCLSLILETSLSAIISSHISTVGSLFSPAHPLLLFPAFPPFFPSFSLWYSHHTQLISFVVVPQFSDTLLQSFHISVWGDCHRHALKFRDSFLIRVQSSDEPIKDILHLLQFF